MQTPSSSAPANPNPKTTQALHFLRLLSPLPRASSIRRRSRLVRRAAYASMALAVGPRMTWSRTILRRLRRSRAPVPRARPSSRPLPPAAELRRLVTGGRSMKLCALLEETGQYIQSLALQVEIMRSLAGSS